MDIFNPNPATKAPLSQVLIHRIVKISGLNAPLTSHRAYSQIIDHGNPASVTFLLFSRKWVAIYFPFRRSRSPGGLTYFREVMATRGARSTVHRDLASNLPFQSGWTSVSRIVAVSFRIFRGNNWIDYRFQARLVSTMGSEFRLCLCSYPVY